MKEYFCIFGGGGIRGGAYAGAIKALEEENIKITGWGGSSVGAVVAGLVAAGYSFSDIEEVFYNIDFDIFKDINFDFKKGFAISKGNNFYEWIKSKIGAICFKELDVELVIFACDVKNSKFYEFSKTKTPDIEIAHAIRVSVGMPGLYAPILNENECLIDGDILKSMPLFEVCGNINKRKERILEFRLENNETKKKISNSFDYFNAVYDSLTGFATDYIIKEYKNKDKYDFIKINLDGISVVDFMISKEKKLEMTKKGYKDTLYYFKDVYPKKSALLCEMYNEIFLDTKKISYFIKNKEYIQAKIVFLDIFKKIAVKKEIMDNSLVEAFVEASELYENNLIMKKAIFGKKPVLIDEKKIIESIDEIMQVLSQKIEYFSLNSKGKIAL